MSILATLSTVSLGHYIALGGLASFPVATVLPIMRVREVQKRNHTFVLAASISTCLVAIGLTLHFGSHLGLYNGLAAMFATVFALISAIGSYLGVKLELSRSGRSAGRLQRALAWGTVASILALIAAQISLFL